MPKSFPLLLVGAGCILGQAPALDRTDAFDRAYATSFYTFDACGDALGGRQFRQVLTERVNQCPFTPAAKAVFRQRSTAQRIKSSQLLTQMIEEQGGLPVRVEGMTLTCRQQQALPEYAAFRERLDRYSFGNLAARDIVTSPCDSDSVTP